MQAAAITPARFDNEDNTPQPEATPDQDVEGSATSTWVPRGSVVAL